MQPLIIDYIKEAENKGLIKFNLDKSIITYLYENKSRNYNNPEEKVQAETFAKLVLQYKYPVENIRQFVSVTIGSEIKQADIIVYNDNNQKLPHIIVECKKENISEQEFIQATNQAFSYAHATASTLKYVWTTSGIKDTYYKFDKNSEFRESISDIPKYGVEKISSYKYGYNGGKTEDGQEVLPLQKVTESELTNIFRQAHQALWGGGELNPSEAFDELDKLIFCKIFDEKKDRLEGDAYDFQIITIEAKDSSEESKSEAEKETNIKLLERIKNLYEEGRKLGERRNDPDIFKDDIKLNANKIRTVVGYLQGIDLLNTDLDSKGRAFETFMGSFFRGDFGQYFTPRKIVSFIIDSLPIKKDSKVLDTSCGSGGFLLHALDKVRREATEIYPKYKEDVNAYKRWFKYWHSFAENNLFGIEINEQIARTAKMNMIIHDDGHTNVVSADGLLAPEDLIKRTGNIGFKEGSFDFIITNPPFGSIIKQTEKAYLHQYSLAIKDSYWLNPESKVSKRPSQSTEVLFIEQAEKYLCPGGYLAIVIPDGILTNSSMQYVRNYISETFRIIAIVSMPQTAFTANGAGVKSSVMFLKKYSKNEKLTRKTTRKEIENLLLEESDEGKELFKLLDDKKKTLKIIQKNIKEAKKLNLANLNLLEEEKKDIIEKFDEKIEKIREILTEKFDEKFRKRLKNYPIFMAIAENIGYNAKGENTGINELEHISIELARFINAIEEENDSSFL
ncbi:restriction endonuclease subunit M [[Clostridium] colinum]|uniref:restriction endonuclease subunit M n=1 Tax=[Clostridium] colinum TaxID=36835 RepID=UPI0020259333|nr:N-6 DNA methylase [[Clostridium] colinum]